MNQKFKLLIMALALLIASSPIFSQRVFDMIESNEYTFEEIQKEANKYFADKIGVKGSGFKQYSVWEFNALRNLDSNGYVITDFHNYEEVETFKKNSKRLKSGASSDWKELGPDYKNRTSSWSPGTGRVECMWVDANNSNHIIIGAPNGGVWKSLDGGSTWKVLTDDVSGMYIRSVQISPHNSNVYFAGTNISGIFKSVDAGETWTKVNGSNGSIRKILIHPDDENIVLASCSAGILRSVDGGDTWYEIEDGAFFDMEFKPGDPSVVYASGKYFYRSVDGGQSFTQVTSGLGSMVRSVIAVTVADPEYLYLITNESKVYRSTNGGTSFTQTYGGSADVLTGLYSWGMGLAVSSTDKDVIFAGGMNMWMSTNGGSNMFEHIKWTYTSNPDRYIHADIHSLEFFGDKFYAGTDGGIFVSEDDATTFTDISTGLGIKQIYKLGLSKTDVNVMAVGSQDNGNALMKGTDRKWHDWMGADGMETFVSWDNPNIVFGCIQNGGIKYTLNGGSTYKSLSGPSSDKKGLWVTPLEQDIVNPDVLYVGYNDLWKGTLNSTKSSATWTKLSTEGSTNGQVSNIKIAPSNPSTILYSRGSKLYKSTTGGTSATIIYNDKTIKSIAIHPDNADVIAIVNSGTKKVEVSKDGGSTWVSYLNNLPSINAECVVFEKGSHNGLYLGMKSGVYYIDDTKTKWEAFMDNLPLIEVRELEIDHDNNRIVAGTYGRGAWESPLYTIVKTFDLEMLSVESPTNTTFCGNSATVSTKVKVKNSGTEDISQFNLDVYIDDILDHTYNYNTLLTPNSSVTVTVNDIIIPAGDHTVKIVVKDLGSDVEDKTYNNELTYNVSVKNNTPHTLSYIAGASMSDFYWEIYDADNNIVQYGTVGFGYSSGDKITEALCLDPGCYDLVLMDFTASGNAADEIKIVNNFTSLAKVGPIDQSFGPMVTYSFCIYDESYSYDVGIQNISNLPTSKCVMDIDPNIAVINHGTEVVSSISFDVYLEGSLVTNRTVDLSLASGVSQSIELSNIPFSGSGAQELKIEVKSVNGNADEYSANNITTTSLSGTKGSEFEFYIIDEAYDTNGGWSILKEGTSDEVVNSASINGQVSGEYTKQSFCLDYGCYDMVVTDIFLPGSCNEQTWTSTKTYQTGEIVEVNNELFESKWTNTNSQPDKNQPYGAWTYLGICETADPSDDYGLKSVATDSLYVTETLGAFTSPETYNFCFEKDATPVTVDLSSDKNSAKICEQIKYTANVVGDASSYEWNFGSGAVPATAYSEGPHNVSYTTTGDKTVTLTVNGTEVKKITNVVSVSDDPSLKGNVSITANDIDICEDEEVTFEVLSHNFDNITSYSWKLNGYEVSTNSTFKSTMLENGDKVELDVTGKISCIDNSIAKSNFQTVSVTNKVTPEVSISVKEGEIFPATHGTPFTVEANITNGGSSPIYKWFVNGKEISDVTSSVYFDYLSDNDEIQCTLISSEECVTDANGYSNKITVDYDITSNIKETWLKDFIKVYPNPVTEKLNLSFSNIEGEVEWSIYDQHGKLIHTNKKTVDGELLFSVDVSTYAKGKYYMKITVNDKTITHGIIKD